MIGGESPSVTVGKTLAVHHTLVDEGILRLDQPALDTSWPARAKSKQATHRTQYFLFIAYLDETNQALKMRDLLGWDLDADQG